MTIRIALDAMGGDAAPGIVIQGAVMAAAAHPEVEFILVGREDAIRAEYQKLGTDGSRFTIQPASQVVDMSDKPSVALRNKRDSSMRVAANLVREGKADAMVSAGNTGALMAIARFILKTLPGIDRPAIAAMLPAINGQTLMLDLGANVHCTPEQLTQFAVMGEVYAIHVLGIPNPRMGILNIGEEEMKGNELVKEAGERIRENVGNYVGNVEGDDIFKGKADVVVCDGFVGNISLKSSEGVAQMLSHYLKESFRHSWLTRLGYLMAKPALNRFREKVDHRRYNGAMLLGLNGIVVKSHGSADGFAFNCAIQRAVDLSSNRVNDKISGQVIRIHLGEASS
ncbi:MAG: phosphate acyltransferase PlsX [Magnetococcales bacterium]|nr:phosphate acyltransferase PlsX [Magnetococcales bacterium]